MLATQIFHWLTSAVRVILNYLELGISPSDEKSFADLLLKAVRASVMYFDLGENEASHQGIGAVCVDFGHGKTHSWRLGPGTGHWQSSLDRWGPFDQQCNPKRLLLFQVEMLLCWTFWHDRALRINFITIFRSQTSRVFRRSVLFKSCVILEISQYL